jgi:hypothetical protein
MIEFVLGGIAVASAVLYIGNKYHSAKAAIAAVEAEISKLESEASSITEAQVKAAVSSAVARIKSALI